MKRAFFVAAVAIATTTVACPKKEEAKPLPAPSVSSASPKPSSTADLLPLTDDELRAIVNPSNAPEYTGPTGVVEGTIKVTGGPPMMRNLVLPKGCEKAADIAGPTYRATPDGALADVLVAVIGVSGYVRPSRSDREVVIQNCALDPTAIDLSLGQRLMVSTTDPDETYLPHVGKQGQFQRVILKDMPAVPVLITKPGIYELTWFVNVGAAYPSALVYVLPNALHTVTARDGKFRIANVPVGKARVTAAHVGLPEASQEIDVKAGEVVTVELTMTAPSAPTAPSTSTSVKKPLLH